MMDFGGVQFRISVQMDFSFHMLKRNSIFSLSLCSFFSVLNRYAIGGDTFLFFCSFLVIVELKSHVLVISTLFFFSLSFFECRWQNSVPITSHLHVDVWSIFISSPSTYLNVFFCCFFPLILLIFQCYVT